MAKALDRRKKAGVTDNSIPLYSGLQGELTALLSVSLRYERLLLRRRDCTIS